MKRVVMLAEARRWLEEARHDLQVVRTLLQGRHYAAACFYSQQAAEKALKGFLYANYERPPLTHSVQELVEQCMKLWWRSTCN
jgi:HEPN domain-containing protein